MKIKLFILLILISLKLISNEHPWQMIYHDTQNKRASQYSGARGVYLNWAFDEKSNHSLISKDGIIYSLNEKNLYALNSINGEIFWGFSVVDDYCLSAALSNDEKIYLKCQKKLYALDLMNGNKIWEKELIYSYDNTLMVDSQNIIYLRDSADKNDSFLERILAIDGNTGQEIWSKTFNGFTGGAFPIFAISEKGIIYFSTFHLGPEIYALDRNGVQLWKKDGFECISDALVLGINSILYCPIKDYPYLVGISGENGEILWELSPSKLNLKENLKIQGNQLSSPIAGKNGEIYFFLEDFLLIINGNTGEIKKYFHFSDDCNFGAISQDDLLYFYCKNDLYCFDLKKD